MVKVKEYLDNIFQPGHNNYIMSNGIGVYGNWVYPINFIADEDFFLVRNKLSFKDCIDVTINDQTIFFKMIIIGGKPCSIYDYLQTYKHLPRKEPDKHGYYVRNTEDEIINYLDGYVRQYKCFHKLDRRNKINKILKINVD